jgi:hypothetical protein
LYDKAFGKNRDLWKDASPFEALSAEAAPMFLVCSTYRRDNSCGQADRFAAKARSLGARAEVLREQLSHGNVNRKLGLSGAYTDSVDAFLDSLK